MVWAVFTRPSCAAYGERWKPECLSLSLIPLHDTPETTVSGVFRTIKNDPFPGDQIISPGNPRHPFFLQSFVNGTGPTALQSGDGSASSLPGSWSSEINCWARQSLLFPPALSPTEPILLQLQPMHTTQRVTFWDKYFSTLPAYFQWTNKPNSCSLHSTYLPESSEQTPLTDTNPPPSVER